MKGDPLEDYLRAVAVEKQPIKRTYQSVKWVSPNITQLQVCSQKLPNLCGFHALSSAMAFDPNHPEHLLDQAVFAQNYFKLQRFLIDRVGDNDEIQQLRQFGELHRNHVQLMILRGGELPELAGRPLAEFNFGFGYLQNSDQSLKHLQNCFNAFKRKETKRLFVLLGITVHWTLVVVDNPEDPHLYYCDSMNYPLKNILAKDYTGITIEQKTLSYFGDLQRSLRILEDMALRSVDLALVKFESQLSEMLVSFAMVDQSSQEEVKKWFQEQYHPVVIRNDVITPMSGCDLSKANPILLREFYNFITVVSRYGVFDVAELQKSLHPYK